MFTMLIKAMNKVARRCSECKYDCSSKLNGVKSKQFQVTLPVE